MLVFTRENYTIPEIYENQALVGYCTTSQTYELTLGDPDSNDDVRKDEIIVGTISKVVPKYVEEDGKKIVDDVQVTLYPLWTETGPIDTTRTISVGEVITAKRVYVHFTTDFPKGQKPSRRISDDPDVKTWVFRFTRNELVLSPTNFIKVIYADTKVNEDGKRLNHAIYGFIQDVTKDSNGVEMIKIKQLSGFRGMFGFETISMPLANVQSIFHCLVEISDFVPKSALTSEAGKDGAENAAAPASESTMSPAT